MGHERRWGRDDDGGVPSPDDMKGFMEGPPPDPSGQLSHLVATVEAVDSVQPDRDELGEIVIEEAMALYGADDPVVAEAFGADVANAPANEVAAFLAWGRTPTEIAAMRTRVESVLPSAPKP